MNRNEFIALLAEMRNTASDNTALKGIGMFPTWTSGVQVKVGDRYQFNNLLYKVLQEHSTQEDWTPDVTSALWTVVNETHSGTQEDPIHACRNMEYVKGLYYVANDVVYLMNREGMQEGESITLNYLPDELVGQYFAVI